MCVVLFWNLSAIKKTCEKERLGVAFGLLPEKVYTCRKTDTMIWSSLAIVIVGPLNTSSRCLYIYIHKSCIHIHLYVFSHGIFKHHNGYSGQKTTMQQGKSRYQYIVSYQLFQSCRAPANQKATQPPSLLAAQSIFSILILLFRTSWPFLLSL